jgi:hypothetical protein
MRKFLQPLIDKLEKLYRDQKYKEGEYFKVSTDNISSNGILPIELLKGPYSGTIYSYGTIGIDEDLGYRGARASFDINIIKGFQNLTENPEFCKITGEVLLVVLEKAVHLQADKFESENLKDEEIGEDYIEEPVPQRTVRKKNSAISKKRVSAGKKRKKSVRRSTKVRPPVQPDTDI